MTYSKINLMQVEKRDVPSLKTFINGLKLHLDEYREVTTSLLNSQYEKDIRDSSTYNFAIRARKDTPMLLTVGFCAAKNIDWVSRHAELFFVMQDGNSGPAVTIPNTEYTKTAFKMLLDFCFDELNLQKVFIDVLEANNIKGVLDEFGFVAEGVRRQAKFKRGRFVDVTVCSLLVQEHREHS